MHGTVAVLDGGQVLAEKTLSTDRRSAQTLASAIVEILASQGIQPLQIELVATTIGPGSFTGLRVGVTAAKTFAYAAGAKVTGVSTLEAIAHAVQAPQPGPNLVPEIHAVLDAQRKELFVGRFSPPSLTRLSDDHIIPIDDWQASLQPGFIVAGTAVDRLKDRLPDGVVVDAAAREPRASIVGQLALRDYQAGRRDDLWKLAPVYLRPSYAEEKSNRNASK